MINGSTLEGAFVNDESNAGNGGDGYCNVVIDKDSTWTVTGDSTITSLQTQEPSQMQTAKQFPS